MTGQERIEVAISRARARRDARAHLNKLHADKAALLERGYLIMLGDRQEDRERWLAEYNAICRLIHEDEHELRSLAA